ncbi:restriction endonuclease subunit S [Polaribacter sp. IC073]|uniref:restriction endonuclease subunit S n=1 Tax=Polaribacter sp. IC073 TaxID=2508540 RepID=UPI0011BF4C08|nr:restriction endonuclease subunit S [Polaribacter sp. IC073]TXD45848.1 restriction endonuclease subunit S [Polaribacter sp. IC073]
MEKQLIPQLRFPNFQGKWEKVIISKIANKITDGTHDTPKPIKEGIPFLTAIHVKDGKIDFDNCYYLSEEEHNKIYKRCNPEFGDLLMVNIGAGTATSAMVNVNYEFSLKNVALIKPNKEKIYSSFFAQVQRRNSDRLRHQISSGGAQPFLSLKAIGKLKLNIPSLPEQQTIAAFLTDVDDKITKLTKKKTLLEQYKKGIMQKIFHQELRFKDDDGNYYPKWKIKKLGDLGSTLNGLTGKTKENFGSGKPYIQYKQIFDSSKININNCGLVDITIRDKQTKVQYGDVFFTTSSETPNEIGTASVLLDNIEEMYLNSFCFGFRVNQLDLYPAFSQFLFRSTNFRKKMIPLAQGSTRYNISKSAFVKLKVSLPNVAEQTKIANFLSELDLKIEALNNNIENSKNFKKGLLQKMFV